MTIQKRTMMKKEKTKTRVRVWTRATSRGRAFGGYNRTRPNRRGLGLPRIMLQWAQPGPKQRALVRTQTVTRRRPEFNEPEGRRPAPLRCTQAVVRNSCDGTLVRPQKKPV